MYIDHMLYVINYMTFSLFTYLIYFIVKLIFYLQAFFLDINKIRSYALYGTLDLINS